MKKYHHSPYQKPIGVYINSMDRRLIALYQSLTQALSMDKGELTPQTRQNLLDTACGLLLALPSELLLKTTFTCGLSKPGAVLAVNSHEPKLMETLLERLQKENLKVSSQQALTFSPIHLQPENLETGWKLWTQIAGQDILEKRFLDQLIDTAEQNKTTTLSYLVDWYVTQNWTLQSTTWSSVFKTIRNLKKENRAQIVRALTHTGTLDGPMEPLFGECLRMNAPLGIITMIHLNPNRGQEYITMRKKRTYSVLANQPIVDWLDKNAGTGHGKMILQHPNFRPEILLNPENGNPVDLICDTLGIPKPKTWKKLRKEKRQAESDKPSQKRRVKARRINSALTTSQQQSG